MGLDNEIRESARAGREVEDGSLWRYSMGGSYVNSGKDEELRRSADFLGKANRREPDLGI